MFTDNFVQGAFISISTQSSPFGLFKSTLCVHTVLYFRDVLERLANKGLHILYTTNCATQGFRF